MKYFVSADIHSFYTEYRTALANAGFDINNPEHGLIICGDVFDRGKEARELLDFLLALPDKRLILIKGNHDDLMADCLNDIKHDRFYAFHHILNGTVETICQLANINSQQLLDIDPRELDARLMEYYSLMTKARDFAEFKVDGKNHILVHGWIPLSTINGVYRYNPQWRYADEQSWKDARWLNGMDMNHLKLQGKDDIIYCGHWHTSYGHHKFGEGCSEFGEDANFDVYYNDGIVALDACTAHSHQVNVITFEGGN